MRRNGFNESRDPILKPLETIECRDAILTADGGEPEWPDADVVIGNPPFLGGKLLNTYLGEEYVSRIFAVYEGPGAGGGRSGLLLVREGRRAGRKRQDETSRPRLHQLHSGRGEPACIAGAGNRGASDLRGVERRAVD